MNQRDSYNSLLVHLKSLDWVLIGAVVLLFSIGLCSLFSASLRKQDFLNFKKQIIFFVIGVFLMFAVSFIDWRTLRDSPYFILFLYFLGLASLGGLFFFAPTIRNIKAWYRVGPISIDPVEPFKIILIVLLARYFSKRHTEIYDIRHILVSGIYVLIPSILVFMQPDLGSMLMLVFLWIVALSICGIKKQHLLVLAILAVLISLLGWQCFLKEYQKQRIISFIFPELEPLGESWSQIQARIAIGSGGLFGRGFGLGSQTQYGFLSEIQTDFIFSAISEEFGFVGVLFLIFLIAFIVWRLIRIAFMCSSNFPRLFVSCFAFLLAFQGFTHIAMNLGLLPIIGVPLPFVSYGGGGLISAFLALGFCQSIKIR